MHHCDFKYASDNVRASYIKQAINSDLSNKIAKNKANLYNADDLVHVANLGHYIVYRELFVPSCWAALYAKSEYRGLGRVGAIDKLVNERFGAIADHFNLGIVDWDFKSSVLTIRFGASGDTKLAFHETVEYGREGDAQVEKHYDEHGNLHRDDGPAVIHPDGTQEFWQSGTMVKMVKSDGTVMYFQNGQLHRNDGPAVEKSDGTKWYFQNGHQITEDMFSKRAKSSVDDVVVRHEITDAHKDEIFGYSTAYQKRDKQPLGYVDFSLYDDEINIKYVEVFEQYRRKGIATLLINSLKDEYPDYPKIYFSATATTDGSEFLKSLETSATIKFSDVKNRLFVSFWVPDEVYRHFDHIGDLDDDLHVTLLYLPNVNFDPGLREKFLKGLSNVAKQYGEGIDAEFTGLGIFNNDDKSTVCLVNMVDGPEFYTKVSDVAKQFIDDFDISYGFIPHMTIGGSGDDVVDMSDFRDFDWTIRHVGVSFDKDDDVQYLVELGTGEIKKLNNDGERKASIHLDDMPFQTTDGVKDYVDRHVDDLDVDEIINNFSKNRQHHLDKFKEFYSVGKNKDAQIEAYKAQLYREALEYFEDRGKVKSIESSIDDAFLHSGDITMDRFTGMLVTRYKMFNRMVNKSMRFNKDAKII